MELLLIKSVVGLLVACVGLWEHADATSTAGCKCPINMQNYYRELNCSPVKQDGACCPSEYKCSSSMTNRSSEKCHLRGEEFTMNTVITSVQAGNPCVPECVCSKSGALQQADFQCTYTDCPENFQDIPKEGCVNVYTADICCSTGVYCATGAEEITCKYANMTYVAGQQIYQSEAPCKKCTCQQGFDGTMNGPWCTEISCGIEIHNGGKIRDGCSPIFYGNDGCCPIGWRCPESTDTVVKAANTASIAPTTAKCTFGTLELNVFDTVSKSTQEKHCIKCTCSVPPHVTCIQKGYSGLQAEGLSDTC